MTSDIAAAWYVVHTHPRAEAKALLNLDRQGFSCYLPRYLKRRRHARRLDTVAAVFPRYFLSPSTLHATMVADPVDFRRFGPCLQRGTSQRPSPPVSFKQ